MMKHYLLIFFLGLIVCQSCEIQNENRENKDPIDLDGYWSTNRISNGIHNRPFILFCNGSVVSFLTPENKANYVTESDRVIFQNESNFNKKMTFEVLDFNGTKMTLKSADNSTLEIIKEFGGFENSDLLQSLGKKMPDLRTLYFHKLKNQNKKSFLNITFRAGPCGGDCDVFYLKIKNTGEVIYYGSNGGQIMNGYKGLINNSEILALKNTINLLPLNQISKDYNAPWTDDQECNLKIDFVDGTSVETSVYGFNEEPTELRAVLYKLLSLPNKLSDLKPSQNVNPNSFNELGEPFVISVED